MSPPNPNDNRLETLRVELIDLSFTLERQGRRDAADLAMTIAARLEELGQAPAANVPGGGAAFPAALSDSPEVVR